MADFEKNIQYADIKTVVKIDFAGSIDVDTLQLLNNWLEFLKTPWNSFENIPLEKTRIQLAKNLERMIDLIRRNTFQVEHSPKLRRVPREWMDDKRQEYEQAVNSLNKSADNVYKNYTALLIQIKKNLPSQESLKTNTGGDMQESECADVSAVWVQLSQECHKPKRQFRKQINFVKDKYSREIIFRDIAHSYFCLKSGLYKSAVILAGGVAEELLRLYLIAKGHSPDKTFDKNIKMCAEKKILKGGVESYTNGLRDFRNYVHLDKEVSKKHAISHATASAAFNTIFTLVNDLS